MTEIVIYSEIRMKEQCMSICRAYSGSEFVVANTFAKWEKLEPNEINFSQGFKLESSINTLFCI